MILYPGILALLLLSFFVVLMTLVATVTGVGILRGWDLKSGSELQLRLERRTYLVSTFLSFAFVFEALSLFYFVFLADRIHSFFHGAMCAAGTLNANSYGYAALAVKLLAFFLAGIWLIVNHVDNRGYDYPLIRKKYWLLRAILPVIIAEFFLQFLFFLELSPDIITSCCGSLFGGEIDATRTDMGMTTAFALRTPFFAGMTAVLVAGAAVVRFRGRGSLLYAVLSASLFALSLVSLISVFSLYVYELPTHHCPFCLLQSDYRHIGYALYAPLFAGAVTGIGAGIIHPFRKSASLREVVPSVQRSLVLASVICYGIYLALIVLITATSNLRLGP